MRQSSKWIDDLRLFFRNCWRPRRQQPGSMSKGGKAREKRLWTAVISAKFA
jgi:hypothetical protein